MTRLSGSASGIGRQIEVLAAGTDHDIDTALQALHKSGSMATGHEPAKAPKPSKLKFEQRSPRAASGHAATAPLMSMMNSRLFTRSLDHLVGAGEQRRRHREAE